ncbi:hypothetical protein NA57DRAFT_79719 [Rhizodiscina lignyota]|uniref:Uncharacterized protein n=1 Tax=Rhizodiscina lignyota TaxID=1504668 RepID=A0A9P4M320_9PEZI|nr:hypothetical protein NA57DRAFT_79719 [Rhizodiscina lignyota]
MPASTTFLRTFASAARNLLREPHPMGKYPVSLRPHDHPITPVLARLGRTSALYVAMVTGLFGWPLAARAVLRSQSIG